MGRESGGEANGCCRTWDELDAVGPQMPGWGTRLDAILRKMPLWVLGPRHGHNQGSVFGRSVLERTEEVVLVHLPTVCSISYILY